MKKIQNFIFNILSLLFASAALLLALQNVSETSTIHFATVSTDHVRVGFIIGLAALLGMASVLMRHWANQLINLVEGMKKGRELEKAQVNAENAEEKVKVLEAKVQTLETALESALKGQQTEHQDQPSSV